MSQFYVLTDQAIAGPLTGVELRESALAGVLAPDCIVGGSEKGPWHSGIQIGLFSDKKVPIPHPSDVTIPTYHVRGMPGAFQGPFKLRELIGFASRGMLPIDAEVRLVGAEDTHSEHGSWLNVSRFRILSMCLEGDLVLLDTEGKIHLRTRGLLEGADASRRTDQFRAPIEIIRRVDTGDVTAFATSEQLSDKHRTDAGTATDISNNLSLSFSGKPETSGCVVELSSKEARPKAAFSLVTARVGRLGRIVVRSRVAMAALGLALVSVVVQQGWLSLQRQAMKRAAVVGQWIANSEEGQAPRFGIAFREDGTCTIFNMVGDSWTGDYEWSSRRPTTGLNGNGKGAQSVIHSTVDHREPHHSLGLIEESDGFLMLTGFAQHGASIDGHPVRDLFVRRIGDELKLGYLTEITWDSDGKTLQAGWVNARRVDDMEPADVVAMLREESSGVTLPSRKNGPGLNEALVSVVSEDAASQATVAESPVGSSSVDPQYLLDHFGVPDEARKIFRFEIPADNKEKTFAAGHLVRYGKLVLMMTGEGDLRYVRYLRTGPS